MNLTCLNACLLSIVPYMWKESTLHIQIFWKFREISLTACSSTLDSTVNPRLLFLFPLCFVGSDKPLTIVSNFQKSFWLIFNITWNKHFLFWQKRWCCKVIAVWKNLLFIMKVPTFTFGEVFWKCLNLNLSPPLLRSVEPIYNSRPGTWLIIHNFVPHFDSQMWISIKKKIAK